MGGTPKRNWGTRRKSSGESPFPIRCVRSVRVSFQSLPYRLSHYQWKSSSENISYVDFSKYFGKYEGSFVLYDLGNDAWSIHDIEHATLRVAPDSTYKIYDALFGLEDVSLHQKIPLLHGMEKAIRLKHGTLIRPYSLR